LKRPGATGSRAFGLPVEGVTQFKKSCFYASLSHRKSNAERILQIDMAKLTKRDIVVAISNQTGMVQHQVFDVVQRTLDKITDSLANNIPVELRNFGVFQPRLTKPRVGRNPNQPGSSFVIPPRATVKFKAGKIMRQRVEKLSRELKEASERKTKPETTAPNAG
jgi:nucleoid DNA-binding protein